MTSKDAGSIEPTFVVPNWLNQTRPLGAITMPYGREFAVSGRITRTAPLAGTKRPTTPDCWAVNQMLPCASVLTTTTCIPAMTALSLTVGLAGQCLLGLWLAETEGAKFWLACLTDLKNRGLNDIFVACIDGLSGFPEAIRAVYPQTSVQLCLVHLVRAALRYVKSADSKAVIADLKKIYQANTVLEAEQALEAFAQAWDAQYPTIAKQWRAKWTEIIPLFDFPPEIRKAIYTTNAIESVISTSIPSRSRILPKSIPRSESSPAA